MSISIWRLTLNDVAYTKGANRRASMLLASNSAIMGSKKESDTVLYSALGHSAP